MFFMPTAAADDIQFAEPTEKPFQCAPQFHENEWYQLEFFRRGRWPKSNAARLSTS